MKHISKYTVAFVIATLFSALSCNSPEEKNKAAETENTTAENNTPKESKVIEAMLSAQQFEALQMQVDTLRTRSMSGFIKANGQLEVPPQNEAIITTVLGANVVSIEVIEGDKVKKGQTVAYLSHPSIIQKQTEYLTAYNNRQLLNKEFERQKTLYDAGVGSGANFQKAETAYQASTAMVNGLEAQLRQLNISAAGIQSGTIYQRISLRSPIDGFVEKVKVKTGQYVDPQTNLIEVVDTHHVHVDLMVFEKDVHKIKVGQKVRFNVQSVPGSELTAAIYSISKTFEDNPKALHVHAEIENKEGNLIPGMYVEAKIETDSNLTLAVPESAISNDAGKSFIFTVEEEGAAWSLKPIEVITGAKDDNWVAITFLNPVEKNMKIAYNNAYYIMAQMKKGDAGHHH